MNVIMYMAVSADGFIAGEGDDTSFVTKSEWASFRRILKRTGNVIIGRRTYDILEKKGEFAGLGKLRVVVVTRTRSDLPLGITTAPSPQAALDLLKKDFRQVLVAGGGQLNASFMKEGLVDELYLDVEPVVLGKGIKLFGNDRLQAKLSLVGTKKLSANEIQLHYTVA